MTEGSVVLLKAYDGALRILALEIRHVADIGATKRVNGLVVVTDRENRRPAAC